MRPAPDTVFHFSEDRRIGSFVPHVARTARVPEAYVWAADADQAPSYWFPRQCPRTMAWADGSTTEADRATILGPGSPRVHAIEYGWLDAMASVELFAYRFDARDFTPYGEPARPHAYVATTEVRPLGPPEPVGDLLQLHADAGIELRLVASLKPWWEAVIASSVVFSGIRLRNARGMAD